MSRGIHAPEAIKLSLALDYFLQPTRAPVLPACRASTPMSVTEDDMDWQPSPLASTSSPATGHLTTLPLDVLLELVRYLHVWDLFQLRIVSGMFLLWESLILVIIFVARRVKHFMSCALQIQYAFTDCSIN